ncbi:MAG: C40 family peptidase [Flavobacteriales bacterium]|nr:C40 family peptidase [Flavobacteriales bacterium]
MIKNYGVCKVTVAPVRASASDESEIVTQLLFGDYVQILEKGKPWIKIRFEKDDYEGWMDFKQLTYIEDEEYATGSQTSHPLVNEPMLQLEGPEGIQTAFLSSQLPNLSGNTISFGGEKYQLLQERKEEAEGLIENSMHYLNAPYLWGGKSLFGIDCSGLTQNVARLMGHQIPRDASQQVFYGADIDFKDCKAGDIPFFINAKGNVHHVGVLISSNQILHASGCVRIDTFDEKGIYREDFGEYTHQYHSIKRWE